MIFLWKKSWFETPAGQAAMRMMLVLVVEGVLAGIGALLQETGVLTWLQMGQLFGFVAVSTVVHGLVKYALHSSNVFAQAVGEGMEEGLPDVEDPLQKRVKPLAKNDQK